MAFFSLFLFVEIQLNALHMKVLYEFLNRCPFSFFLVLNVVSKSSVSLALPLSSSSVPPAGKKWDESLFDCLIRFVENLNFVRGNLINLEENIKWRAVY